MTQAVVIGTGYSVPDDVVPSTEVERRVNEASSALTIPTGLVETLSGVRERRHAPPGMASSDLAADAARKALAKADVDPLSIDLLIFASASQDLGEPATSAILQYKTGCRNAVFLDVKNACNSFINGLDVASAAIATGRARRVLVAAGEVLSPTINYDIPGMGALSRRFAALTVGDAGAALVVEAADDTDRGLLPARFDADGSYWGLSTVYFGGTITRLDVTNWWFEADSAALQDLALTRMPPLLAKTAAELGWTAQDVAFVVPHQVSQAVISGISSAMGYPDEQCLVSLTQFGNTAAASVPLALSLADEAGRLTSGDKILLIGGAAGFSAAVLPLVW